MFAYFNKFDLLHLYFDFSSEISDTVSYIYRGSVEDTWSFFRFSMTSFYFEWMWTSEAPTLPNYTNDSSIDSPWWVDLGKTQEKFSKKILRFLPAIMLFLRRLRLPYTGRLLVSFALPFIQNKNSSIQSNIAKVSST